MPSFRTRLMARIALLSALFVLVLAGPALAMDFERSSLVVETKSGGRYRFTVEMAITPEQQERGLMFRKSLSDDAGMLFVKEQPETASFWMKNTFIPLDMIFIAENGVITNIHANAEPKSLKPIYAATAVTGILEINGGLSAKLGIRPGDRVLHSAFGTAEPK
ncbi:MAG TPA: DUF192 domain-containing protein [Azospirillaceae bacterium]|nr:DUF192 domain-containing protein [Azospirillaceae bacterium]